MSGYRVKGLGRLHPKTLDLKPCLFSLLASFRLVCLSVGLCYNSLFCPVCDDVGDFEGKAGSVSKAVRVMGSKAKHLALVGLGKGDKLSTTPEWGVSPWQVRGGGGGRASDNEGGCREGERKGGREGGEGADRGAGKKESERVAEGGGEREGRREGGGNRGKGGRVGEKGRWKRGRGEGEGRGMRGGGVEEGGGTGVRRSK